MQNRFRNTEGIQVGRRAIARRLNRLNRQAHKFGLDQKPKWVADSCTDWLEKFRRKETTMVSRNQFIGMKKRYTLRSHYRGTPLAK